MRAFMSTDDKPDAGLWRRSANTPEGKYLVVRRDGTIPEWPNFVIGAKDPFAPAALRAYADEAQRQGAYFKYVQDIRGLAAEFETYRELHGDGDPDKGRHRIDDPGTITKMQRGCN